MKQKRILLHKRVLITLCVSLIAITPLTTACSKERLNKPVISKADPSLVNGNNEKTETYIEKETVEEKYVGQVKEGIDYLKKLGLKPASVLDEGTDHVITWEDLCDKVDSIVLNAFLDSKITDASSSKGYTPVNLKSIRVLLEDEANIAELFFYEDKILGGISYPQEDRNQTHKRYRTLKGETLEEIRNINFPVWMGEPVSKPTIYYLKGETARKDGFEKALQIEALDKDRYLIVYENKSERRVYVYDTKDATDFYTGISFTGDLRTIRVKPLEGNKTALWLPQKIIVVNSTSFEVVEEIQYPEDMILNYDDLDISPDGKRIAYIGKQGLTVTNHLFADRKVIVKTKLGKDPNGQDSEGPRYPKFSPDSARIMYHVNGYEWTIGTGVITPDGMENEFFEAKNDERIFTQWYDSHQLYSQGNPYRETGDPVLLNILTGEKTPLVKEIPSNKLVSYYLGKDRLFYQARESNESDIIEFGYYDPTDQTFHKILDIPGCKYISENSYQSLSHTFVFTINNYPLSSTPAILVGI